MRRIEVTIKKTYRVRLSINVSDEVYDALCEVYDGCGIVFPDNILDRGSAESIAEEWLSDNIREKDLFDYEYDIEDLSDVKSVIGK